MKPIIGLTCSTDDNRQSVHDAYIEAVVRSGGVPILLPCGGGLPLPNSEQTSLNSVQTTINIGQAPLISEQTQPSRDHVNKTELKTIEIMISMLDGLIFTGGGDIHPSYFGEDLHPKTTDISERRDSTELRLCGLAIAMNLPILCICRGMQVLNVAMGGTLIQHIDNHKNPPESAHEHAIDIERDSLLSELLDGKLIISVNSRHHQAVLKPGRDIVVSARAQDKTIEAIEIPKLRFALGVQWHPEELARERPDQSKLFEAFIRACASGVGGFA